VRGTLRYHSKAKFHSFVSSRIKNNIKLYSRINYSQKGSISERQHFRKAHGMTQ